MCPLPRRAFQEVSSASRWKLWEETGPYAERVSELLEQAKDHIIFLGWQIDSRYPLQDALGNREKLGQKLARICRQKPDFHAYLLFWDHASFYTFEREKFQKRIWSRLHQRIHFVFDSLHPLGASHHEKLILIDGVTAFCGGIDLCDRRIDFPEHDWKDNRRSLDLAQEKHGPYHDRAVEVEGEIVESIYDHVKTRWSRASRIPFPQVDFRKKNQLTKQRRVYFSRTASYKTGPQKNWRAKVERLFRRKKRQRRLYIIKENERLHLALIRQAHSHIVIEGQYYWSARINRALIRRVYQLPDHSFSITLILTDLSRLRALTRQMAAHGYFLLTQLQTACEQTGTQLRVCHPLITPPSHLRGKHPRPVYVHSKLILIDDRYLSIGSTNLAARAFRLDSEVNLTWEAVRPSEQLELRDLRRNIFHHWGIEKNSNYPLHEIQNINPTRELRNWYQTHPLLTFFPWRFFFDPEQPWLRTLIQWTPSSIRSFLRRLRRLLLRFFYAI